MSVYFVSDIHSCWEKFPKSIPKDTKKLILLGDMWNKGTQQLEMFTWCMKNRHDERYVFVWGNAEARAWNEICNHFFGSLDDHKYCICYSPWWFKPRD